MAVILNVPKQNEKVLNAVKIKSEPVLLPPTGTKNMLARIPTTALGNFRIDTAASDVRYFTAVTP